MAAILNDSLRKKVKNIKNEKIRYQACELLGYMKANLELLDNGDLSAQMENHLVQNIKFKNLSNEYKENVTFLTNELSPDIGERTIRKIIKEM